MKLPALNKRHGRNPIMMVRRHTQNATCRNKDEIIITKSKHKQLYTMYTSERHYSRYQDTERGVGRLETQ